MKSRIALFPGSFDPITKGHEALVLRALSLFDEIVIGIGVNSSKQYMFSLEQRIQWIKDTFKEHRNVQVTTYQGLTIEFARQQNITHLLRGLRDSTDFNYERSIAQMNKALVPEIDTVFLITEPEMSAVSSSILRDVIRGKGDVSKFLPEAVKI